MLNNQECQERIHSGEIRGASVCRAQRRSRSEPAVWHCEESRPHFSPTALCWGSGPQQTICVAWRAGKGWNKNPPLLYLARDMQNCPLVDMDYFGRDLIFPSSSHHIFPCLCSFPFLISSSVFHHSTILSLYLPTLWLCWLDHVFSCVYLFALVVFGLLFQLLGQSSSLWRTSETGSLNYAGNSHKHALFAVQKQIFGCAVSQMKLPSMYPDETNRAQLVHFLPVEGNQRDGSPPCCASGRKEFTGTGRFPLSEQVRLCTSSHIDAHLVQKAGTHHHLYVHITATVWRREQQKETQHFTTASFITSQSL